MNKMKPQIGMGATYQIGSDRYPYTIVEINGNKITVQQDIVSNNEIYFYPNVRAEKRVFSYRKKANGWKEVNTKWNTGGTLKIGERDFYRDPSF